MHEEKKKLSLLLPWGGAILNCLAASHESRGAQGLRLFQQARGKRSDGITSGVRGERIPCVLKASVMVGMF